MIGSFERALVIKLGHLGDVLLAAPVISVLKRHAPQAEIDALVYAPTAPMLSEHPDLAELFVIRRGLRSEFALAFALRRRRYDLVVALSDKPRAAWVARLTGARYAVTLDRRRERPAFWRRSFTHFYPFPPGNTRHTVELHLDALRALGIEPRPEERRIALVPGVEAERRVDALLAEHGLARGSFFVVHPASRWLFKCWPAPRVAELVNRLQARGERVVVTGAGDANEAPYMAAVRAGIDKPVLDLAGKLSLKELAATIGRARLFFGADSAPLHMASAMGTPAVVLFGPSGEKEWGPWQIPSRVLTSRHSCRPCGNAGCGGGGRSECLEVIPLGEVLAAIDGLAHA